MARTSEVKLTAEQATAAMKFARTDRFKMSQDLIGIVLKVEDVEENTYDNGEKSYNMVLRTPAGKKVLLPFAYFRDGRVVSSTDIKKIKEFLQFKEVYFEPDAEELINKSELVSRVENIEKNKEYVFPSEIKIKAAIVPVHQTSKKPLRGIRNYKEFDVVADHYRNTGKPFPQMRQFEAELAKKTVDGRIPTLNPSIMNLEVKDGIADNDLSTYRVQFIFEDIKD